MILLESILDGLADIRNHLGRTLLQLLGIILGAGSIVATFSLAAAQREGSKKLFEMSGGIQKISISNKQSGKVTLDAKWLRSPGLTYTDALAIRRSAREIDLVSPVAQQELKVQYRTFEKMRGVMGVSPAYGPMNDFRTTNGRFITDLDLAHSARVVVLGAERAREFFGSDNPVGKTLTIDGAGYRVAGVMEEKYFSFDGEENELRWMNRQMYIPITTLIARQGQSLSTGKIAWMHARMKDIDRAKLAVEELEKILQREHGVRDFEVISRLDRLRQREDKMKMYNIVFMVCGIISLFVGGIVVMNIQLASFNERIREVGIRKAIGASSIQIFGQFVSEAVVVATLGGVIGIFVGRLFSAGISSLTGNMAIITPQIVTYALVFAAGTGLFFGIYPAIKASSMNPIEALRTE